MKYFLIGLLMCSKPLMARDMQKEKKCLATTIYGEARGENEIGMLAVAHSIMNRMSHERFPNGICKVVFQKGQYSIYNDKTLRKIATSKSVPKFRNEMDRNAWAMALTIAEKVLTNQSKDVTLGATHFYSLRTFAGSKPKWSKRMVKTKRIKNHAFYKLR